MEIAFQTKYELGEELFALDTTKMKMRKFIVNQISYDITHNSIHIWYHSTGGTIAREEHCFRSVEEFTNSLCD